LDAARSKEEQSKKSYSALMDAKGAMLKAAEDGLVALVEENGARGLSKAEATDEVENLEAQMLADTKFLEQTEISYQAKSKEFEARRQLRMDEIKAVGQAINILHSDDARDAFRKSYSRMLLQVINQRCSSPTATAVKDLWSLASSSHNSHLALIAARASEGRFTEVFAMIDKLVKQLQGEEATDLEKKEMCETDRAENTRQAASESRSMDGLTDDIDKAKTTVASIVDQISEQEKTMQGLEDSIASLTRQREDENKQFLTDVADDEKAVQLILSATTLLTKFYEDHGLTALADIHSTVRGNVQLRKPIVEAGKAPPPPPATWAAPSYGGAGDEQAGIQGILSILKEDIENDITSAKSTEAEAKKAYDTQTSDLEAAITAGNNAITEYETQKASAELEVQEKKKERQAGKANLDSIIQEIKRLQPGCDFFTVNFAMRTKKRQIEIDGLTQAKAILSSANTAGFLQETRSHRC